MADQPISLHYQQMEEWLSDRKSVFGKKNAREFEGLLQLAPRLVQQVQYDIPAVLKQVKKCESGIEECRRVCEDADRVAASSAEKRRKLLAHYGLTTDDASSVSPDNAALQTAIDLRIETGARQLTEALVSFAKAHLSVFRTAYNEVVSRASETAATTGTCADGDFTAHFPWLARLEEERLLPVVDGAGTDKEPVSAEIATSATPPQIDWGDGGEDAADVSLVAGCGDAANAVEIVWNAEEEKVVGQSERGDDDDEDGAVELPAASGVRLSLDVSRARDRTNLLMELNACACFGGERAAAKDERLHEFVEAAKALTEALTSSTDAEFLRMRTNFRERRLFEERIASFDRSITAACARKAVHELRSMEMARELERLVPELDGLLCATTETRDACLANLSAIFPGRSIMIVGDINKYI